jgi:hypothetical protein
MVWRLAHTMIVRKQASKLVSEVESMDGIIFLLLWIGCASLHTYYDLKIKPALRAAADEQTDYPGF